MTACSVPYLCGNSNYFKCYLLRGDAENVSARHILRVRATVQPRWQALVLDNYREHGTSPASVEPRTGLRRQLRRPKCKLSNISFENARDRDHGHKTGQRKGTAHQKCYINCLSARLLPVVTRNLKGDDSHLICVQV